MIFRRFSGRNLRRNGKIRVFPERIPLSLLSGREESPLNDRKDPCHAP
ncbi:hypothetical protein LptCag_1756 [Leptospirillum ferriphilum]|uniref:Uncharacterized protein n=1 Tax=Leptospirillum ferriphilum TaxID=178606 RepID=A0A094WAE8_9BACT|nr:hypothetical protein LptCag_1756 [Leptospirillum ferriphilum]